MLPNDILPRGRSHQEPWCSTNVPSMQKHRKEPLSSGQVPLSCEKLQEKAGQKGKPVTEQSTQASGSTDNSAEISPMDESARNSLADRPGAAAPGKVIQIGHGRAVTIRPALLDAMSLAPGDAVEIVQIGGGLAIFPEGSPEARALAATRDSMERHADIYRRLSE